MPLKTPAGSAGGFTYANQTTLNAPCLDIFLRFCESCRLAGISARKRLHFGFELSIKIERGEVQRGSIRLYHASCRQSGSAETSYFEKYLPQLFPGAKIGVLGLNGAGKSTLLRIMAGIDTEIEGEARPQPGIKIGYLPQEPQLNPEHTVRESVEEAVAEVVNALKGLDEVYAKYAEPDADFDKLAAQQGKFEEIIQAHDGHNLNVQLERAADALRLPDWDAKIANLSGGERRRVALCRLLLEKPDMLLLDEPTNHLDAESVAWLERFLHDFEGTVVAITHDRYFLDNVAGWILELDRGEGIPWEGNYSSWLEQKDQRLAQEASQEAARRKSIEKELEWVRQGAKGRQSKGKARLARFEELNNVEYQKRNETNELFIPPGPRLGDKVLEVSHLRKSYGDRVLIDDLSFSVPKGAIVGIIGPNGAGKSTLFRMMSGRTA